MYRSPAIEKVVISTEDTAFIFNKRVYIVQRE